MSPVLGFPTEGRPRRIIRIHHKLVRDHQQLTHALAKRMGEGDDFHFEMRNDFYIIQVYGPKDINDETEPQPAFDCGAQTPKLEVTMA